MGSKSVQWFKDKPTMYIKHDAKKKVQQVGQKSKTNTTCMHL